MRFTAIIEEEKNLQDYYLEFVKFKAATGICERTQKDYQRLFTLRYSKRYIFICN